MIEDLLWCLRFYSEEKENFRFFYVSVPEGQKDLQAKKKPLLNNRMLNLCIQSSVWGTSSFRKTDFVKS